MKRLTNAQWFAELLLCVVVTVAGCKETPAITPPATSAHDDQQTGAGDGSIYPADRSPSDLDPHSFGPLAIAEHRLAAGDLEGALQVLRDAYHQSELNLRGMLQLVRLNQAVAFRRADAMDDESSREAFLETGELAKQIVAEFPQLAPGDSETVALALYNAACSAAFRGRPNDAVDFLTLAVDVGFVNYEELEQDPDLDSIRPLESFLSLRDRLRVLHRCRIDQMIRQRSAEMPEFKFDFSGRDLEDRTIRATDFRGRPLIVFIWLTGLPACQEQARCLIELLGRRDAQSLAVVGLAYDPFSSPDEQDGTVAEVRRIAKSTRFNFPCLIGDERTKKQISKFEGYPSLLFLDRAGTPRLLLTGLEKSATVEAAIEWVSELPVP